MRGHKTAAASVRKGIEKSPAGGTPGRRQPRRRTASRRTARECGDRQAGARGAGRDRRARWPVASTRHGQSAATTARSGFRKQSRATSTAPVTRRPAASVREGMEDTQTVTALGVGDTQVRKALAGDPGARERERHDPHMDKSRQEIHRR